MRLLALLFLVPTIYSSANAQNMLCSNNFCKDVACEPTSPNCDIGNETHSGIYLPSPQTCNCCSYCLPFLHADEECSVGSISSQVELICGPGLYCSPSRICEPIISPCTEKQASYDERRKNGTLGTMELRPDCDAEGLFAPYNCIPGQTCYCLDENGDRIFGQADFTNIPQFTLACGCSRKYADAVKIIGHELNPAEHLHCQANGDFDEIQCTSSTSCYCVSPGDGFPQDINGGVINATLISKSTLSCFDDKVHVENLYYTPCEQEYFEVLAEVEDFASDGFNQFYSFPFPKCDLDGSYSAVQMNVTHKYCVDPNGNFLAGVLKTDELAETMNCNCVRASYIMSDTEKPSCLKNGNYNPIQCRRSNCRCVDINGTQICNTIPCEGDRNTLNCNI